MFALLRGHGIWRTTMPLISGSDLPNKRMSARAGYDGWEPKEISARGKRLPVGQTRIAVVMHQDYAPVLLDTYLNRTLIGLVQDALSQLGLSVVLEYIFIPNCPVPAEERCALCENEEYLLVNDALESKGSLIMWSACASWFGPFYEESTVILDIVLPDDATSPFMEALTQLCRHADVDFRQAPPAETRPRRSSFARVVASLFRKRTSGRRSRETAR